MPRTRKPRARYKFSTLNLLAEGTKSVNATELTPEQQAMVEQGIMVRFRLLTFEQKVIVSRLMEMLVEAEEAAQAQGDRMLPSGCCYALIAAVPEREFERVADRIEQGNKKPRR